jgi:hypothetical protein
MAKVVIRQQSRTQSEFIFIVKRLLTKEESKEESDMEEDRAI